MPTDLYTDALAWSGQQSALLRRLAAGERVNDAIDWPNVIEEIADVGKSELRAVQSLIARAIKHLTYRPKAVDVIFSYRSLGSRSLHLVGSVTSKMPNSTGCEKTPQL